MSLTLITGPAGSGKTGEVLERFTARLEEEPVLVVPTRGDAERFEDELLARRPVALGGRIVTFERLFTLAADAAGVVAPPELTPAQRRGLLASVVADADLRSLAGPAQRRGFVHALDRLVAECQAALVTPAQLSARLGARWTSTGRRGRLLELGELYSGYVSRRDALGYSDRHAVAAGVLEALEDQPWVWATRPVLVQGFDDLTGAQLALLELLANDTDVVVSVMHEAGRACLAARGRLVDRIAAVGNERSRPENGAGQLTLAGDGQRGGPGQPEVVELPARRSERLLAHLERAFLTDAPERREPDGGLRLLDAAGPRNEIEQVGAAIARLLRTGIPPDAIGVIARAPESCAALVEEVFEGFGIPTAIRAERPVTATATGRGLLALLRAAFTTRSAKDVIKFLRSPGCGPHGRVDRLEREVRRRRLESADEAAARWLELSGRAVWELEELRAAGSHAPTALLTRAAAIARDLAERPYRRAAPHLDAPGRAELSAGGSVAASLDELAELAEADPGLAPDPARLITLLEGATVPWSEPSVAGRVELLSPYRGRARQFAHVFVLSLQEGEFPRRRREDPFLLDDERRRAGLPEQADARDEERYLFYVCLTRATRALHLSSRSTDDEGAAAQRSFFVDEVLDMVVPGAEAALTESKGVSATVFWAPAAPTQPELARALAERRLTSPPPALGASEPLARRLAPLLERARERADRLPGRLRVPYVVEQFAGKTLIGASSLETNAECSFRYFVDHELDPKELQPEPEPLRRGAITHRVLERVLSELGERPTRESLAAALERARAILAEEAAGTSLDPCRPSARPIFRRMASDLERYLRSDVEAGEGELEAVEGSFGAGEDDQHPALKLNGFSLHGKIDRIDRVGPGQALIHDYKTGTKVAARKKMAEELKLQLPLYMLAVRRLWRLEPVGGVYHPLGKQYDVEARGLLRGPRPTSPVGERFARADFTADEAEFEQALATARGEAERLAARIHAGHLDRDPLGGSCPSFCDFHPICRRERGEKNASEDERRKEENGDE